MNGFQVAADVGPMPEALGVLVTQAFTLFAAKPHAKLDFYTQNYESPIEDRAW